MSDMSNVYENLDIRGIERNIDDLCPLCIRLQINSSLIKRNNLLICNNKLCDYISHDIHKYKKIEMTYDQSNEIVEINKPLLNSIKYLENYQDIITLQKIKKKGIRFYNWLLLPNDMKIHSKIVRIILMHLDSFDINCYELTQVRIKHKHFQIYANLFHYKINRLLNRKLVIDIFNLFPMIPTRQLKDKTIDQLVVMNLKKLFKTYSVGNETYYVSEYNCDFCDNKSEVKLHGDFIVPIDGNYITFQKYNEITYKRICKCRKPIKVTVKLNVVTKFICFHTQRGISAQLISSFKNDENYFQNIFNEKLSLIGVLECLDQIQIADFPEKLHFNYEKVVIPRIKPIVNYSVHFRTQAGWIQIKENSPPLISTTSDLIIRNPNYVKLLIFGSLNTTYNNEIPPDFSLKDFVKSCKEDIKSEFVPTFLNSQNAEFLTTDKEVNQLAFEESIGEVNNQTNIAEDLPDDLLKSENTKSSKNNYKKRSLKQYKKPKKPYQKREKLTLKPQLFNENSKLFSIQPISDQRKMQSNNIIDDLIIKKMKK